MSTGNDLTPGRADGWNSDAFSIRPPPRGSRCRCEVRENSWYVRRPDMRRNVAAIGFPPIQPPTPTPRCRHSGLIRNAANPHKRRRGPTGNRYPLICTVVGVAASRGFYYPGGFGDFAVSGFALWFGPNSARISFAAIYS